VLIVATLIGFPLAKVEAVSIYSLILSVVLLVSLVTGLCLVGNLVSKVLKDKRQMTNDKQQKSVDEDLQLINCVELKTMEVCCDNHKDKRGCF
jgi:Na+-transporting NADH:ubiquinone oxidoreductase subunit NqrC